MSMETPAMVLPDWLTRQHEVIPEAIAIEWDHGTITYEQLYKQATGMAAQFRAIGIEPGENVAVLAKSGVLFAVTMHALMQLGAVPRSA